MHQTKIFSVSVWHIRGIGRPSGGGGMNYIKPADIRLIAAINNRFIAVVLARDGAEGAPNYGTNYSELRDKMGPSGDKMNMYKLLK